MKLESLKFIKEILIPYVEEERKKTEYAKPENLALDVFKGQLIQNLFNLPNGKNFVITSVRADMTHEWYEWYTNQIMKQLNEGKELHAVEVKLQLTMFKPLHAQ